jgi:hypothetical protein
MESGSLIEVGSSFNRDQGDLDTQENNRVILKAYIEQLSLL